MPAPAWLIEGLFEVNSLVMVAGPPGNFKSFLAIDWVLSMAVGRKWHTRPTCPSKVLYCLGEGKSKPYQEDTGMGSLLQPQRD
jgi:RecA-family ATPase